MTSPNFVPRISSLASLELDRVVELIATEAKSEPGRRALQRRLPATTIEACESSQARLADMVRFYHREGQLPIAGLTGVGVLFGEEILDLAQSWDVLRSLRATQALRETFVRSRDPYPLLTPLAAAITDLSSVSAAVGRYFTKDGKLREEASAELRSIRTRIQSKRASIQKTLNELMLRHADAIQEPIITLRGDRYCIPVRADRRPDVAGILHERSGSGASFFIEPLAIVETNNDLAGLLIEEREEIARITRSISQQLAAARDEIAASVEIAGELDAIQACAIIHSLAGATRPRFTSERQLELIDARHPLLDERLESSRAAAFGERPPDGSKVVPVTLRIRDGERALVISGPNAGGKTVSLKTAGLLVALAASGFPVPAAEGSIIPVVDAIEVLIGDDQDVLEHLSTFSAYLARLRRILERTTERSLILLDELGSGTDPEEGGAIAAATVEYLLERGVLVIVTTHLSSLKSFAMRDPRIVNASMEFDAETGRPSFQLILGVPGRSRAIDVARMIGLPSAILDAARKKLGSDHAATDDLLAELQRMSREIASQRDEILRRRDELERELERVSRLEADLSAERKKLAEAYRDDVQQLKDDVRSRLQSEMKRLRELDPIVRTKASAAAITEAVVSAVARPETEIDLSRPVAVGDRVRHRTLRLTGKVVSISGSRANLDFGGKKMQTRLEDLVAIETTEVTKQGASRTEGRPAQGAASESSASEPAIGGELNLIGQRVEEALDESDKFLDRSLLSRTPAVRLIHGFGTGKLRKAVREHLRDHPAVKSFRPGRDNEGGDGATVAFLDV